ncbi:MAG: mandelate racemase/muconate lactonizing enzyme family protein, partial [Candidatus Brocadiia bacterium]|nr:mandelate racemase/muconate lactonizing enzyme family protein [Candidatus Brocadiia bacterium]
MKITGIKTYKFSVPTGQQTLDPHTGEMLYSKTKAWLFLKIDTDAGIVGWGEGSGSWITDAVDEMLQRWSDLLVGQDPLCAAALTEDILNRLAWKGGGVLGTASAAVNIALYDIAGKAWGVPVHTILGGNRRDRVRVYSNGGSFASPEKAVEAALAAKSLGYAGVKGNPLETRTWAMDLEAVELSAACVAAVREAVGPGFDILMDTHGSPTPEISIELARRVAPFRPLFLEEPVKVGSVEALMEVSRKSPVPIATGEKLYTLREFKALVDRRACAYLQPDVTHCCGITGLMDIAGLARQSQMLMAPHNAGGP